MSTTGCLSRSCVLSRSIRRRLPTLATALALAALTGCEEPERPAIVIEGGGFIFNYRVADVTYGVAVRPQRKLEAGATLEAEFEDPAGGTPVTVTQAIVARQLSYALQSPPVSGVKAGRPYRVVVRLRSPTGAQLASAEKFLTSDLDQDIMPSTPLTQGPGYAPNPAAE
jgi:hypothetical protein